MAGLFQSWEETQSSLYLCLFAHP